MTGFVDLPAGELARVIWFKSPGQLAYERDVQREPCYAGGQPRRQWHQLDEVTRWSWERNPTERKA